MKINNNEDLIDKIIYTKQYHTIPIMWYITKLNEDTTSYYFIWLTDTLSGRKPGSKGYWTPCHLTIENIKSGFYKVLG